MKSPTGPVVSLQRLVQDFFEKHLSVERRASKHTVLAYRDSLKLFLRHAADCNHCDADELDFTAFDVDTVRSFLEWLRNERKNAARTRNHRLAAIKSFARYVASAAPEHLERCRQIRDLRPAAFEHREVNYLDQEQVLDLVRAARESIGFRDLALILLLYNTGARVQELVDLDLCDIRIDPVSIVTLQGKGRKQRTCPIWARTVNALQAWINERGRDDGPLFLNKRGHRLSRSGVAYILRRLSERAEITPRHTETVSPHVIRHTTAMHLLEAGVDITTIAAWLGHSQISTTHGYVEIDLRMKQKAIAFATELPALKQGTFPEDKLLSWLTTLGKNPSYAQRPPPNLAFDGR